MYTHVRMHCTLHEQEEAISIVLQLLALAVFDCILVGMLRVIAPDTWQPLKQSLCDAFSRNKNQQVRNVCRERERERERERDAPCAYLLSTCLWALRDT
jgi:hypothetical protein